jgi:multidrug efflux system outer membrane protein
MTRSLPVALAVVWGLLAPPGSAAGRRVTLVEAYRLMMRDAPALRAAEQDVFDAQARHTGAVLMMAPQLSANGQVLRTRQSVPLGELTTVNAVTANGIVSQPVFRAGLASSLQAANRAEEGAQFNVLRLKQTLMYALTNIFILAVQARQLRALADDSVKRTEAQLANATARVKAGGALRSAELLASIELRRAQAQRVSAELEVQLQENEFARITLTPPPPELVLPPPPPTPGPAEAQLHLHERADLKAARKLIEEREALVGVASANRLWPTIDLQGNGSYINGGIALLPWSWQVDAVVNLPLFQGGQEYVEIQRKRIDVERAKADLAFQERIAKESVLLAAARLASAIEAVRVADLRIKDAEENYNLVASQFRLGAVSFLEAANAQSAFTDAAVSRVTALNERERATFELLYVTGDIDLEAGMQE